MRYILKNAEITAVVESLGAELVSLTDRTGTEYIWSADEKYWNRHSPILFPIVGRLKENKYKFEGKEYSLPQHGFARDEEFELVSESEEEVLFVLKYDEKPHENYPFLFVLEIGYKLSGKSIEVTWKVKNLAQKGKMYFSIGAHPGFVCPLPGDKEKAGYSLKLGDKDEVIYHESNFDTGLQIRKEKSLKLNKGLCTVTPEFFDESTYIIEDNQLSEVSILTPEGRKYVTVRFDMPIVSLWSREKYNAPFICIEPWCGRCDSEDFEGTLEEKEWGNELSPGETFEKNYFIEIG